MPTDPLDPLEIAWKSAPATSPSSDLRRRILAAVAAELVATRSPPPPNSWPAFRSLAALAATGALWIHLVWHSTLAARPNSPRTVEAAVVLRQADRLQSLNPELSPQFARNLAVVVALGADR